MWGMRVREIKISTRIVSADPDLACYAKKLKCWAANERLVRRVFIFGSRVRGNYSVSSDLDIAVELPFSDPNTNLAHFQFEQSRWKAELMKIIGLEVDLQLLENSSNSIVRHGVSEDSVLAYWKAVEA